MQTQWKWYVYIAICKDGTYYTGMTWNLENRTVQHLSGKGGGYTKQHGFIKILYFEEYRSFDLAFKRERQLHGWSHKKKNNLLSGKWKKLG